MIGCVLKNSVRKMSFGSGRGLDLKILTGFFQEFAPVSNAEKWDNTGLLVEPMSSQLVHNVLLTNDLTEEVVSEALGLNVNLIVSYHPPIFKPLMKITKENWKERVIGTCLENKIAVYSPHTSWDCVPGGINDWLASAFDIESCKPINVSSESQPNFGAGRYCKLMSGITVSKAIENVKELTKLQSLQVALAKGATLESIVEDVAICAGSGASVLKNIHSNLCLTGEMSHHELLDAIHNGTNVILCNHSNSERGFLNEFKIKMDKNFASSITVYVSEKDKDPLQVI